MNKFVILLIVSSLFLSGIIFKPVSGIYAALILIGAYLYFKESLSIPNNIKQFYFIALFVLVGIVISVLHYDWNAFFQWRFQAFLLLLFVPLFYVIANKFIVDENIFWKLLVSGASFTVLWLIMLAIQWPVEREVGLLSDPINRGNLAMLFGIVSMIAFFALQEKSWKTFAFLTFLSGVFVSILSGSRGGWLALVLSILTMTIVFLKFKRWKLFLSFLSIQISFVFLLIIFWHQLPLEARVEKTIQNIVGYFNGDYQTSIGYRFVLWKSALYAFLEKPIWGWGWSNFDSAHQFVMAHNLTPEVRLFGHPHNQFLLFLVETGIFTTIGLVLFLIWPIIVAVAYLKKLTTGDANGLYLAILMISICEAMIEFSLSDDTFSQKYFIFVFMFISISSIHLLTKYQGHQRS